jgi:glycosyltransferase involved in cell wall biosynthesis
MGLTMKIVFLSRAIRAGGAERQLNILACELAVRGHDIAILTFYAPTADVLVPPAVRLISAGKRGRWDAVSFFIRIVRVLRHERPDVLHAYLPTANAIAALIHPLLPACKLVFGVRSSKVLTNQYDWLEQGMYALERLLSSRADLVIANSHAGARNVIERGFPAERVRVVVNGIDTNLFRPDRSAGSVRRAQWGVAPGETVIGVVGRLDPMKDHETFLTAFASLVRRGAAYRAVFVGAGPLEPVLRQRAAQLDVADRIVWAGQQDEMMAIYNAFDILCLPSAFGEGVSNALAEAMACEVPCVATNVGDSAMVVGACGRIVAPRHPAMLADALAEIAALPASARQRLGAEARIRIKNEYGLQALVNRTVDVLGIEPGRLEAQR